MGCATGLSQHTGGQVVGGELHQADRHMRGNGSKVWRSNFTWPVELRGAPRIIPPFLFRPSCLVLRERRPGARPGQTRRPFRLFQGGSPLKGTPAMPLPKATCRSANG